MASSLFGGGAMDHGDYDSSIVDISRPAGGSPVVLICEHASNFIPAELKDLGLSADAKRSHVAWDPGALGVAQAMSDGLDATLVASRVSRLVYDCNRPQTPPTPCPPKARHSPCREIGA
uniref:N-formylglutamate amidohydrolase n=1 Tax=Yoonia rhodophyticola TaxID=3137370 RepID=A0AAN0NKQ8_9RHOB